MKLSTANWLPGAIVLPILIAISNITPASAEQIDRSKSRIGDTLPSVTDLNLLVPVAASQIAPDNHELSNSIEPFWSNPDRTNLPTTISKERVDKVSSTSKLKSKLATIRITNNIGNSNSSTGSTSDQPKSKSKKLATKNTDPTLGNISKVTLKLKSNSRQRIAAGSSSISSGNYLRLIRDPNKGNNDIGNPIYTLETYIDGQKDRTFDAVSGTATTQTADRHRGNNFAPLPDGLYAVSNEIVDGTVPEVGRTFIGIFPKFETGRNDLGIHLDRSFNKTNGYDGTAGCIGITTIADRDAINYFIKKYHPRNLIVSITTSAE
jgi:hypothetical protein